ncbi:MAG: MipA/OmpV family protein [Alphaproteobacteria bacterium]
MKKYLASALAIAAVAASTTPASAEPWRVRLGLGAQVGPQFPGDDSLAVLPYPKISVARGDKPFAFGAHDDSFSITLLSSGGFSFGPAAQISEGRDESDLDVEVGDVDRTIELGAFAQYYFGENFRLRGEIRKALGGHDGVLGHVAADYVARDGDRYAFAVGPRVRFVDSEYMESFFGISPEVSLITGLPVYDPDGGLHAVGVMASGDYSLGGPWGLFGYVGYDRLVGDAKDSPIVRDFGSPNQFSAGIGVSYTFNLNP